MYHHQPQGPQGFPGGPRPQNQPLVRPPADMMPPVGPYQFPRPTQLPDELESALSIRGSRDMDHRLIEHLSRLKQHQSQASAPGLTQQHGNYGTNLCDSQPKQQSIDWSSYEPPTKLFAQHPGGHTGTGLPNWNPPMSDSSVPPQRAEGGRGFYTPESAGTILASFGLSNEDLEALSHYPDDQLTPDTLPFILRDLQIHKKPKASHSPDVPSLLSVTQTEGRVIDYGHASQAKDENGPPKTFKKEPMSTERTVKMYPAPAPKLEASVGRQVRLEPAEPIKHGDRDYRRRSSEHQSSHSPPPRDFSTAAKPRHQDRDYRLEQPKPRASAEKRSGEVTVSKPHPPPTVKSPRAGLKAPSNKKLPTPTMMNDFSGVPPKVYPHTCSLCDMQCDQEQEWIGHLETVNHTAACRHLRTTYPDWKPKLPSRDYGKRQPSTHLGSRSASWSPPPPPGKHRGTSYKVRGKAYDPHHVPRHHPYHTKDVDARFDRPSRGGAHSFREYLEKKELAGASRTYLKRPYLDKRYSSLKGDVTKKTLNKAKTSLKSGHGPTRPAEEGPPAKKKKVTAPVPAHGPDCLVYLTHIPKEATEQEVINLAGSFGPINNVLLMPSLEEEEDHGQQASVCMMKAQDAQAFANAPNLLIRDRVITAMLAKNPEEQSDVDSSMKPEQENSGDHTSEKKKGAVLIEGLPDSGWTEEHLTALAEPFGYPDDVIVAKQIRKALLLMPDVETAREMVKVYAFSPASINEHKVTVKNVCRNLGMHTPVALYNLLMHGVDGVTKTSAVSWGMLVVVSNVPETPSSASIVHKLVSRIGTVFNTLAVKNMVIFEMATGPLATAVFRHYLKFPCMIQNNPLVFSRKPDTKTPHKVIPAFLDTDKEACEDKKEPPTFAEGSQTEVISNPVSKEEMQAVEIKCEQTEAQVMSNTEENPAATTTITVKEEPMETQTENVIKIDSEEAVTEEVAEKDQTSQMPSKENGAKVQTVEESKPRASTEGATMAQDTTSQESVPKAVSAERETQVKASRPSAPSGQKRTSREKSKDLVKNSHHSSSSSREEERRRADRERRERESRDRERRERERSRKDRDYDERSKRDYERERRGDPRRDELKREEMKRAWRKEWERREEEWERREQERREGKRKPYSEMDHKRSDGNRRSHHRDRDERHKSSSERRMDEDNFPFSLSDFVTVDEVGDIDNEAPDAPTETETGPGLEPGLELGSELGQETGSEPKPESEPGLETQTEQTTETRPSLETQEKAQDVSVENVSVEEPEEMETEMKVKPEEQTTEELTKEASAVAAEMTEEEQPAESIVTETTEEPCPSTTEETSETNQEEPPNPTKDETQKVTVTIPKEKEEVKEKVATTEDKEEKQETNGTTAPSAEPEASENGEKDLTEDAQKENTLPPFDPNSSVGLEYLVPMTGFFCKVCTRFFTGAKDAQIGHSKTLKHYENLQKFLKISTSMDEATSN